MKGYVVYWPNEYVERLEKYGKSERISVVFGGYSAKLPSMKKVKTGDAVYPVNISGGALRVIGRLTVGRIEPAYDYLVRETGLPFDCLFPDNVAVKHVYSQAAGSKAGKTYYLTNAGKFESEEELPAGTEIVVLEDFKELPHRLSQEPPADLAAFALSGSGSEIRPRPVPSAKLPSLLFVSGKELKPLKLDKNGKIVLASVAGQVRLASDETRAYLDSLFQEEVEI